MKTCYYSAFAAFALVAIACNPLCDVSSSLNKVEGLLKEAPDSALCILEQIDPGNIRTMKIKARYSLLHTMAIDRCGIDSTDYTLIIPADTYYLRHGTLDNRVKMHFYKGRLSYNNEDYDSALKEFLVALDASENNNDPWLKGMICSWISIVYSVNHNASEELRYRLLSYDCFVSAGDRNYIDNACYLLALSYHNNKRFSESDSLYAVIGTDSRFYPSALLGLASNEMFKEEFNAARAVELFKEASECGAPFTADMYYQYAYALMHDGKREQCESLLGNLKDLPEDVKTVWWKYLLARDKGDAEQALSLLERYREESGEFIRLQQAQSAYKTVSEYYSDAARESEEKATKVTLLSIISLLLLVALVLVVIIVKQRKLLLIIEERDELERNNVELQDALEALRTSDNSGSMDKEQAYKLWESYVDTYRKQHAAFGRLIGKDLNKSVLPNNLESLIRIILNEISENGAKTGEFEQRINNDLNNVMLKYRQDYPELTPEQYRFASLVFAGYKDDAIAALMHDSLTAVSSKRSRLKKKILNANNPGKDFYAVFFKNSRTVRQ